MNVFRNIFSNTNFVHVPKVVEKLSTKRLTYNVMVRRRFNFKI